MRLVFTILLVLIIIGYTFSVITLDINVIMLLALIILIWFTPTIARHFENIQFKRDGDKLEFSLAFAKLREIEERAGEADLLETPTDSEEIARFVAIAKIHPNSALVALRTDLERKLQEIVQAAKLDTSKIRSQPMGRTLEILQREGILTREEANVYVELRAVLNQIVHAADVPADLIQWAINTGPFLLSALDKKLIDIRAMNGLQPIQREQR